MRRRSERGVVLAQVLIMTLILGYIAAMILRMVLQPAMVAANTTKTSADTKKAEAAINRVQAAWIEAGTICNVINPRLGVKCDGATNVCSCTCTFTGLPDVKDVKAAVFNGACQLTATVPDKL